MSAIQNISIKLPKLSEIISGMEDNQHIPFFQAKLTNLFNCTAYRGLSPTLDVLDLNYVIVPLQELERLKEKTVGIEGFFTKVFTSAEEDRENRDGYFLSCCVSNAASSFIAEYSDQGMEEKAALNPFQKNEKFSSKLKLLKDDTFLAAYDKKQAKKDKKYFAEKLDKTKIQIEVSDIVAKISGRIIRHSNWSSQSVESFGKLLKKTITPVITERHFIHFLLQSLNVEDEEISQKALRALSLYRESVLQSISTGNIKLGDLESVLNEIAGGIFLSERIQRLTETSMKKCSKNSKNGRQQQNVVEVAADGGGAFEVGGGRGGNNQPSSASEDKDLNEHLKRVNESIAAKKRELGIEDPDRLSREREEEQAEAQRKLLEERGVPHAFDYQGPQQNPVQEEMRPQNMVDQVAPPPFQQRPKVNNTPDSFQNVSLAITGLSLLMLSFRIWFLVLAAGGIFYYLAANHIEKDNQSV